MRNSLKSYTAHHDGDSPMNHQGRRVALWVLGAPALLTGFFAVAELVGGLLSGSLALTADAGHMATDALSLTIALVAGILSRGGADEDHSYGHGRFEVLAAFVNAILMLGVVGWIFWEAAHRFSNPPPVAGGMVMVVAGLGLVVNIGTALCLSGGHDNMNARAALIHVMGDLLGSVAAITAGAAVWLGGDAYAILDPILSVFVGLLVLKSTVQLILESTRVLLDAAPGGAQTQQVGDALLTVPGILSVHDLHVWMMTAEESAITAHLVVARSADWNAMMVGVRNMLRERFGITHVTLQPEFEDVP